MYQTARQVDSPSRLRSLPVTLMMLSLLVTTLSFLPTCAQARLPPCQCGYGVVLSESEACTCQCFPGYLQPRCLYTADANVTVKVLWYGDAVAMPTTVTAPAASALPCAQWPDWYDEDALTRTWSEVLAALNGADADDETEALVRVVGSRCVSLNTTVPAQDDGARVESHVAVMESDVALMGWAAQYLTWQVSTGTTAALIPPAFGSAAVLADVRDSTPAPASPPRYVDTWLRIIVMTNTSSVVAAGRYWYISLEECGWLIGAPLLALALCLVEYVWLFNTEHNVGGGLHRAAFAKAPGAEQSSATPLSRAPQSQQAHRRQVESTSESGTRRRPTSLAAATQLASHPLFSLSPGRTDGSDTPREEASLGRAGLRRRHNKPAGSGQDAAAKYPNPLTACRASADRGDQ